VGTSMGDADYGVRPVGRSYKRKKPVSPVHILVLIDHYLPGQAVGGPVRSVANLVQTLGNDFVFSIVTRNRDMGSSTPYSNVRTGEWTTVGNSRVLYLSDASINACVLWRILVQTPHDVLYLNSALSFGFSIVPMVLRKLRLVPRRPVVLASRGQLSNAALAQKPLKKRSFIALARVCRLYQQPLVTWQASTEQEERDIRETLQRAAVFPKTRVALNAIVPRGSWNDQQEDDSLLSETVSSSSPKVRGELNAAFLSRISPKKNLLGLLEALKDVHGRINLSVYGPVEDARYWRSCLAAIARLPVGVVVTYRGILDNDMVASTLSGHQLFVLPTFGENFGHVIAEALIAGCPVLTTDTTPWQDIASSGAGTIIRGTAPEDIAAAIQQYVDMDAATLRRMSSAAKALGDRRAADPGTVEQNRALFLGAAFESQSR
jgi:glycosyltransferase involved in cell wall biosynthesis